jgi:hypothetical protein
MMPVYKPYNMADLDDAFMNTAIAEADKVISNGLVRCSTIFMYPDHDNIDAFIGYSKENPGKVIITDMGYTYLNLSDRGRDNLADLAKTIEDICESWGCEYSNGHIICEFNNRDSSALSEKLINFCHACLRVAAL